VAFPEREVRKATRDMTNLLAGIANPLERMDALQKRNTELYAEMKKLEREHVKTKKRADQLQKEKDSSRSELSKTVSLRERLEKLCRELTRENKKMKVRYLRASPRGRCSLLTTLYSADWITGYRTSTKSLRIRKRRVEFYSAKGRRRSYGIWTTLWGTKKTSRITN
jgi:septal ring factor EnvC (AmiA/AmiB activator)